MTNGDLYKHVTNQIIEKLEQGVAPWRKPWLTQGHGAPRNAFSNRTYNGINVWLLALAGEAYGWSSGLFATFRQWKELGGFVQKGQKGTQIVFWNVTTKSVTDANGEEDEERRFFARSYTVFALEQCAGDALERFHIAKPESEFIDFEPAETAIAATGADLRFGGSRAYYDPTSDYVQMPAKSSFESPASYYATALHELSHWTGHPSRLNRLDKLARFGDRSYAMEELVTEMSAAFLTASLGVPNTAVLENSASYLADWLTVLRSDSRAIFTASSAASKAADLVLSFSRSAEPEDAELVSA